MDWSDIEYFEKINRNNEFNSYKLSMILSKYNRDICIYYKRCIIGSEVFAWILGGRQPKNLKKYIKEFMLSKSYEEEYIDEELKYIDDVLVKSDVRSSLLKSLKRRHLIYSYRKTKDNDFLKTRVRILSKIIWGGLREIEFENKIIL